MSGAEAVQFREMFVTGGLLDDAVDVRGQVIQRLLCLLTGDRAVVVGAAYHLETVISFLKKFSTCHSGERRASQDKGTLQGSNVKGVVWVRAGDKESHVCWPLVVVGGGQLAHHHGVQFLVKTRQVSLMVVDEVIELHSGSRSSSRRRSRGHWWCDWKVS
jgi:hypothetical protein